MDTTLAVPSAEMVPMYVLWVLRSPAWTAVVSTVTVGSSRGSSTGAWQPAKARVRAPHNKTESLQSMESCSILSSLQTAGSRQGPP